MQKRIYEILNEIGVPCGLLGRDYLAYAIEFAYNSGRVSVTKVLYPTVVEKFNTTQSRADRAIRHAIERAFDIPNIEIIKKYFGNTISFNKGKLANSDLIYGLVEYLKFNN